MRYFEECEAQLECDLLNRRPGQMKIFVPKPISAVPHRETVARTMYEPQVDWDATKARTRRLVNQHTA